MVISLTTSAEYFSTMRNVIISAVVIGVKILFKGNITNSIYVMVMPATRTSNGF